MVRIEGDESRDELAEAIFYHNLSREADTPRDIDPLLDAYAVAP